MGTELIAQGHPCPEPAWSAMPLLEAPEAVEKVHRAYAQAGAKVLTTNTFRTRANTAGERWAEMAERAVDLARKVTTPTMRVAGSIAPLEDCYRPDLSPRNPGPQHAQLAEVLAHKGVDILLCETFPHIPEALAAVQAAIDTSTETWVSFTAGPDGTLLRPDDIRVGAKQAVDMGAAAILVNCIPASQTHVFLDAISDLGVPFGAYANAGHPDEGMGWSSNPEGAKRYADHAERWIQMGASLIGSCCGTGPQHIRQLHERFCRDG